MMLDE
jgi:hypothetical protein